MSQFASLKKVPQRTLSTVSLKADAEGITPKTFDDVAEVIAKIMILGDSGCGRLRKKPFNSNSHPTPGIDFATHIVKISDGKHMRAQIVDTSGLDKYRSIVQNYWGLARGAMIVFDLTSAESFTAIRRWVRDFKAKACPPDSGRPRPPIMIVGNKMDLENERQVQTQDARNYAVANGFFYTETSAKDDVNVDIAFNVLLTDVYFEVLGKKPVSKTDEINEVADPPVAAAAENFVESIARIGRTLSTKRKPSFSGGTPSRRPSLFGDDLKLSPFRSDSTSATRPNAASPSIDEVLVTGARTLWKWVGEVVDDLVDELEGIETQPDNTVVDIDPVQFRKNSLAVFHNPMVGVVVPPAPLNQRVPGSGSESGSYPGYETDDSDEGQLVVDFLRGHSPSSKRRPYIPPRSESSQHSASPPNSPNSSFGGEFSAATSSAAPSSPESRQRSSKPKILPRKASLAVSSLGFSTNAASVNGGGVMHGALVYSPPLRPSSRTPSPRGEAYVASKLGTTVEFAAPNYVVEVSSITPIDRNGIGARSILGDDYFVPPGFMDEPRTAVERFESNSDTLLELDEEPAAIKQRSKTLGSK
ncbi:Ras- protein Rab-11A [Nowakowskiella sp. JEL0078]|nr:Ras- protein Rab-11A [Nowakowskiella sp. JEL0078]